MAKRPCLDCGTPSQRTRCPACERPRIQAKNRRLDRKRGSRQDRGYTNAWQRDSRDIRKAWVAEHGYVCPGWQRPGHPAADLVVDHDVGVLCRTCNAVKANTHDRQRGKAGGPQYL